jgi:hydrogenase maturation protein HypF
VNKIFKIQIGGRVQGVGFRPFVFNLATAHRMNGTVSNNENGVLIYCNSTKEKTEKFLNDILQNKPEVSVITSHTITETTFMDYESFLIVPSKTNSQIKIPLTPDFAICQSCKKEISDAANRRYNYAFTTCVHCGPRYAITEKFPFERAHTSIDCFKMCNTCNEEYSNPHDRRFHSQTNSCSSCGIHMKLTNCSGDIITTNQDEIIKKVVQLLSEGNIIAIKNTNGYLLCCDASNVIAINDLRNRKKRPNKPFAVLYESLDAVKRDYNINAHEEDALQSRVAPIVILQNIKNTNISVNVIAPNLSQTGVMLPSSSLLELIMQQLKKPVVATSGNIHGSPIISKTIEAKKQLEDVADYFLNHNLEIQFPQDDSVLKFVDNTKIIYRRSRGLAPNYLEIETTSMEPILAMGAHLKSTFTLVPNGQTYVSQYFGNLNNYDVLERFKYTINQYFELFEIKPKTILVDKHPQYQSSVLGNELALKWETNVYEIQHHKAHFTSVLGEHNLFEADEKILGIVWDGTGLGDDNNIWGGEFFTYHNKDIVRLTHFEYYDWLANDKMATEPRLALFSLLNDTFRNRIKHKFSETEWKIYSKTIKKNTLKTSSVGRLFDAVASALDIVDLNTYEAEAAMQLENCANTYTKRYYIDFLHEVEYETIPSKQLVEAILKAYREGFCKERLAYSFIYTLAKCIIKTAKSNHIKTIACSGGVFQNSLLVSILSQLARKEEINLKLNRKLSPNDENVSFGQLMYYRNIENKL